LVNAYMLRAMVECHKRTDTCGLLESDTGHSEGLRLSFAPDEEQGTFVLRR